MIAILIKVDYERDALRRYELPREMDKPRMELEMLLNPDELDHLILLYLIHQSIFKEPDGVSDYSNVKYDLRNISFNDKLLERTRRRLVGSSKLGDRISHILRLSHVVLKREWERVKHTR